MKKIRQLYKEWQSLQPLNEVLERNINQQFMIDFNYNSNHLEGNTLTYGQTKLLLLFGDTIGNANLKVLMNTVFLLITAKVLAKSLHRTLLITSILAFPSATFLS